MKLLKAVTVLLALGSMTLSVAGRAADPVDLGQREYQNNCAVCHGALGKGDGPYAGVVNRPMGDLTRLASSNGGVFPVSRVYGALDGTRMSRGHGTTDMPIWGREMKDAGLGGETDLRGRLVETIVYLRSIQQ